MFGSKEAKRQRMQAIVELLAHQSGGLSQVQIARALGVPESTILRDLQDLEDQQILITDDGNGELQLFEYAWQ